MNNYSVLKKPVLTEKTAKMMERENKYTFAVTRDASKGSVKAAIKAIYGVTVLDVNMSKTSPKNKRSMVKRNVKYVKDFMKKAIVKVKQGETIKVYEEAKK